MAVISSKTLILYRVCWLWSCDYFLFRNPVTVYSNFLVVVLGQSLDLPHVYDRGDQLAGILACVLGLVALDDFVILFQEGSIEHWRGVVPLRLAVFFVITFCSYYRVGPLANSLAFTYSFIEMMVNFLLYIVVREELNENTRQIIRKERGQDGETADSRGD